MNDTFRRSWISPLVAITFIIVGGTGVVMLGHVRSHSLRELHEIAGLIFVLAAVIHTAINWRALIVHCRRPVALLSIAGVAILCLVFLLSPRPENGHAPGPDGPRAGERHPSHS